MLEMKDFQAKVMEGEFLVNMEVLRLNICLLRFIQKETEMIEFFIKIPHVSGLVKKIT